ncbi:MAG: hypothetical protein ED556_03795 [Winogradskyella sp.]|uniref:GIDE domain-containing protein n=1 Tax=Winogradskyella sp. TaxID=1883156 RepID=UPI000F41161C|nr:GIDE domain-containing protein [Winogradskyella sp.]RNC88317.1 MAG: hypothetical protein ED556_03795 [Winogradskyella sp.]
MEPFLIISLFIGATAIIIFLSHYFSNKQIIKRSLSKIPFRNVTNLRQNELSKLHGKALHVKAPLIAPYSKRECIFYQIKIQKRVSNGKSTRWKTLVEEERMQEFFIENNGDMVIVKPTKHPKNYKCFLVKDQKQNSGTFNDASPKFEALLRSYNIDSTNWLGFNKTLRYEEGIIEIGEAITVSGIAKWKSLSEPIPEYPYSKIAELESGVNQKLLITDLPETFPPIHKRLRGKRTTL